MESPAVADAPHLESEEGADGSHEKIKPAAAKEHAETTTGDASADSSLERGIGPCHLADMLELALILGERVIFFESAPGELADRCENRHVDAMFVAFAEFRIRVLVVVDVEHERRVHDVLVNLVFRDTHEGSGAHHVAHGAVRVGSIFHKELPGLEQQVQFMADMGKGVAQLGAVRLIHPQSSFQNPISFLGLTIYLYIERNKA